VLSISLKEENQPLAIMASGADLKPVSVLMVGCSSLPKAGRPFRPKGSAVRVLATTAWLTRAHVVNHPIG
jgi:hypothetical protein